MYPCNLAFDHTSDCRLKAGVCEYILLDLSSIILFQLDLTSLQNAYFHNLNTWVFKDDHIGAKWLNSGWIAQTEH